RPPRSSAEWSEVPPEVEEMLRAQLAAKGGSQPTRSDAVRGETLRNEAPVRAIGPSSEAATQRPGRGGRRAGASAAPSGAPQAVDDEAARTEGAEPVAGTAPTRRRTARTRAAGGLLTRGHPRAIAAVRRMVVGGAPHALLLSGPASVGKTTLALDLAAGLLCLAEDPSDRPCRACRACRQLASGNHPDLHRLAPEGPGGQVGIGQVRSLSADLALLPVEGLRRVAI